jgi:hypothetical protein
VAIQPRTSDFTADKIINFNEARGPDPGFRHRWLDRLQDDPERRQSTFSVAYALARRIDPKKAAPEVWPGIESIAGMAQVSISTAKTELKWLHDRGWLAFGKRRPKYVVRVLTMPEVADPLATSRPVVADPPATVVAGPPATITTTRTSPPSKNDHEDTSPRAACAAEPSDRDHCLPDESKELGNDGTRGDLPRSSNEDRYPRIYRQSPAEAARAWSEISRLDNWAGVWGDGEMTYWHALLRKGYAADDILDFALNFLRETPLLDVPPLGDFLARFESYLEDEDEADGATALPPMQQHPHHAHA